MRLLLALSLVFPACAADNFYLGTWKIVSAVVAPWYDAASRKPTSTEMKGLVGKSITIEAKGIRGPRELACTGVRYVVKEYPADMLFQGAFGEIHERDKLADPVKIAASVGFRGGVDLEDPGDRMRGGNRLPLHRSGDGCVWPE